MENSAVSEHKPEKIRTWRATIDAWKQSGQTINAFCRERKLTRSNFDRWRRIFAAEPSQAKPSSPSAFVPLQIVADPMFEVVLVSGITVRLPLSASSEAITRLVATVGAVSC